MSIARSFRGNIRAHTWQAILALRAKGHRIYAAGHKRHLVNGKPVTSEQLLAMKIKPSPAKTQGETIHES